MAALFRVLGEYLGELAVDDPGKLEAAAGRLWEIVDEGDAFSRGRDVVAAILSAVASWEHDGNPDVPARFAEFRLGGATRQLPSGDDESAQPSDLIKQLRKVLIRNRTVGFDSETPEDVAEACLDAELDSAGDGDPQEAERPVGGGQMTFVQNLTVAQASVFVFSTYRDLVANRIRLEDWEKAAGDDCRRVGEFHDCLTCCWRRDLPDHSAPTEVADAVKNASSQGPSIDRLGQTTVLAIDIGAGDDSLVEAVCGRQHERLSGGPISDGLRLFGLSDAELLLLFRAAEADAAVRFLNGPLELIETLRHKVEGQVRQYFDRVREKYLDAGNKLCVELERFQPLRVDRGDLIESVCEPRSVEECDAPCQDTIDASERVTTAYRDCLLLHGTVAQIEAMLTANVRSLQHVCDYPGFDSSLAGGQWLRQRVESLRMRLDQLHADTGLVKPTLEAAKCVAELCHGHLLATLTATEARENRSRTEQGSKAKKTIAGSFCSDCGLGSSRSLWGGTRSSPRTTASRSGRFWLG